MQQGKKYKRIYYDCIPILIDKTKELPVLYETDTKDSLTVYLKNVGINVTRKSLLEDIVVGDGSEISANLLCAHMKHCAPRF